MYGQFLYISLAFDIINQTFSYVCAYMYIIFLWYKFKIYLHYMHTSVRR